MKLCNPYLNSMVYLKLIYEKSPQKRAHRIKFLRHIALL